MNNLSRPQKVKLARLLLSTSSFLMRVARRLDRRARFMILQLESPSQSSS